MHIPDDDAHTNQQLDKGLNILHRGISNTATDLLTNVSAIIPILPEVGRKFLLSTLSKDEMLRCQRIITLLGGYCVTDSYFNDTCTHAIAGHPRACEIFLGACAAGLWILQPSYLDACSEAGEFISEEKYEWTCNSLCDITYQRFLAAPRYWRSYIYPRTDILVGEIIRKRAFEKWKVLLYVGDIIRCELRRILEAGGAEVISDNLPVVLSSGQYTHAFVQHDLVGIFDTIVFSELLDADVLVLKTEFIAAYLLDGLSVKSEDFEISPMDIIQCKVCLAKQPVLYNNYLLHYILRTNLHSSVVDSILNYFPALAQGKDNTGQLPLHMAVTKKINDTDIIFALLRVWPGSCCVSDNRGETPFNLIIERQNMANILSFLRAFLKLAPSSEEQKKITPSSVLIDISQWCDTGYLYSTLKDNTDCFISFFLESDGILKWPSTRGSLLCEAIHTKDYVFVQQLLKAGCSPTRYVFFFNFLFFIFFLSVVLYYMFHAPAALDPM